MPQPQSFANHGRLDPPYHFFFVPVVVISTVWAAIHAFRHPSPAAFWLVVVGLAAGVGAFKLRLYALKVQDRLIRLEERLRLSSTLPANLHPRIAELDESQLIALRFASDRELATLVPAAIDQKMSRKQIKQAITEWRPDHFRV